MNCSFPSSCHSKPNTTEILVLFPQYKIGVVNRDYSVPCDFSQLYTYLSRGRRKNVNLLNDLEINVQPILEVMAIALFSMKLQFIIHMESQRYYGSGIN